jgi:hypothetical protein
MEEDQLSDLERVGHRFGVFNDYQVLGINYRYVSSGVRAWHITSWPLDDSDLIHTYWVVGGQFLVVSVHSAYRMTNNTLIQTFGEATHQKEDEQKAILEGIASWENLQSEQV